MQISIRISGAAAASTILFIIFTLGCPSLIDGFSSPAFASQGIRLGSNFQYTDDSSARRRLRSSSKFFDRESNSATAATSSPFALRSTPTDSDELIDVDSDPRLRRVRLSRATGIEWGTDLSFSFVYIRALEPSGAADLSGMIEVGDQICEFRPVTDDGEAGDVINLTGAPFDQVMNSFASLPKEIRKVDLVFFRGTKEELKAACAEGGSKPEEERVTITVIQNKGAKDENTRYIEVPYGSNVREVLTNNGINVYQSLTRWTNCKGKQLCGTCIVNIKDGAGSTNRKSIDEGSTLRENPESYRLSCVTFAYGDVTVETFPPINAAQWTR